MSNPIDLQRISLGKLKTDYEVNQLIQHLRNLYNTSISVITGTAAPTSIPPKIGAHFIDITNNQVYVATGNKNSSQWVKVS